MFRPDEIVSDARDSLGGAWGWFLAFGVVSVAAGVCMFFFTGLALYVIAIAFGAWLVVSGIVRFFVALAVPRQHAWIGLLYALLSAVAAAAGVYLIAHPVLSLIVITAIIGIVWILSGTTELFIGTGTPGFPHRVWAIFGGLLGIVAGWFILFTPGISTLALAFLLGVWLILYGLALVISAFRIRSVQSSVRAVLTPRHT